MQPTAEPDAPAASPKVPAWRSRLPEILTQALLTLVAVVLAFAVEEWREEQELDRVAEEARLAILQELRHNHEELLESRQDTLDSIAELEAALVPVDAAASPALRELVASFELALLSTAAWHSAQSADAARRMEYDWVLQVARAYELQGLYERAQWAAIEANMAFQAAEDDAARAAGARALLARLHFLAGASRWLEGDYTDIL